MAKRSGMLIVVSGASGTGKGTVLKALLDAKPELKYSVSATTREPRPGEKNGVNYHFLSREEFEDEIAADGFLEWADVYGNYYGTLKREIDKHIAEGEDVLLEIDTQGALKVMEKCPDGVFVFLLPPSREELRRRLTGRGTETAEAVEKRLNAAAKEIDCGKRYKYVVVNDEVEKAVDRIAAIITAEGLAVSRNAHVWNEVTK